MTARLQAKKFARVAPFGVNSPTGGRVPGIKVGPAVRRGLMLPILRNDRQWASDLAISSVIFLASPSTMTVLSR
jgi:hypothetical protein